MCLDHIEQAYRDECEADQTEPNLSGLLTYCFDRSIITHHTLIHYFVLNFFFKFLEKCDNVKQLAYWEMENYIPLGWRQITEIRRRYPKKFSKKK